MNNSMTSVNRIIITGFLTKDPEYKEYGDNTVCKLNIVSIRPFQNKKTGQASKEITYIDIELWGPLASFANQSLSLSKGSHVFIEGRLKLNSWIDEATSQKKSKLFIIAEHIMLFDMQPQNPTDTLSIPHTVSISDPVATQVQKFVDELPF